jgi:hypothetical protein
MHRVLLALALGLVASSCEPALAHDWYTGLTNKLGWHCCNQHDFKPVKAWQDDDGRWHAIYDGVEYVVPDYAILPDEKNLEPFQAHMAVMLGVVRCFLRKAAGG